MPGIKKQVLEKTKRLWRTLLHSLTNNKNHTPAKGYHKEKHASMPLLPDFADEVRHGVPDVSAPYNVSSFPFVRSRVPVSIYRFDHIP